MMRSMLILTLISIFFISCSSKKPYFAPRSDSDNSMSIKSNDMPISLQSVSFMQQTPTTPNSQPLNAANQIIPPKPSLNLAPPSPTLAPALGSNPIGTPSAPLAIINPHGSALTVWALAEGNWIWGYTLDNSKDFGDARVWQLINLGGDIALIKNLKTNTCIYDEGRGITHRACDRNSKNQQWQLLAMDTGAVQLRSSASKNCIRTDFAGVAASGRFFSIIMEGCSPSLTIGQQWIFIPEPKETSPLLGDR